MFKNNVPTIIAFIYFSIYNLDRYAFRMAHKTLKKKCF